MKKLLLAFAALSAGICPLRGQCPVSVSGIVIDDLGSPLGGAMVMFQTTTPPPPGPQPLYRSWKTADDGTFTATVAKDDTYFAFAVKPEAGYLDLYSSFYDDFPPLQVVVNCQGNLSGITIRTNAKTGHIGVIVVVDNVTKRPITNASIRLERLGGTHSYLSSSTTHHDTAVPSGTDITYVISAPGYLSTSPKTIYLKRSESIDLHITLTPKS